MTKSRHILAPRRPWQDWELELIRANYADSSTADLARVLGCSRTAVYQRAAKMGLAKSVEFIAQTARERTSAPGHPSHAHRFTKGFVPANKGLQRPGWAAGDMARTQFKKGQLNGRAAQLVVPIGSTRVNNDGYLDRKVSDEPGPQTRRWVAVHRLVWAAAHGTVPHGHAIVFKPGRRTTVEADITLDALECISRRELMTRNSYHQYGPEVAQLVQLRGAISRQINKRSKEQA
jgi:hypothetical protein